ncbi:hypothetical protein QJS10_CPA10g01236 [Acorus calamus]|uniref:Uncharacterized protein n=1 Tax=Acorus calamus TaxID=4465 RepID=A0AAV9E1I4_ACOCL|nr:hypothetical protein QJS10_CPA10g01236 [Acorus calamus]
MSGHPVGGSSSTGKKLSLTTCLGSTEGIRGVSMKLLMTPSNELQSVVGRFNQVAGSSVGGVFLMNTASECYRKRNRKANIFEWLAQSTKVTPGTPSGDVTVTLYAPAPPSPKMKIMKLHVCV